MFKCVILLTWGLGAVLFLPTLPLILTCAAVRTSCRTDPLKILEEQLCRWYVSRYVSPSLELRGEFLGIALNARLSAAESRALPGSVSGLVGTLQCKSAPQEFRSQQKLMLLSVSFKKKKDKKKLKIFSIKLKHFLYKRIFFISALYI